MARIEELQESHDNQTRKLWNYVGKLRRTVCGADKEKIDRVVAWANAQEELWAVTHDIERMTLLANCCTPDERGEKKKTHYKQTIERQRRRQAELNTTVPNLRESMRKVLGLEKVEG